MTKIAIIPARGGSKRIPRKNIKEFFGKPIIVYSIEAALKSNLFDEVMVSTDDVEIAEIAKKYGAKVPFIRSAETSHDMAMTVPVLLEVLSEYKNSGQEFDYLCCIYSTAPFVTSQKLIQSFKLLKEKDADAVFPMAKYGSPPVQKCFKICNGQTIWRWPEYQNMRSQDLDESYHDTGQFYWMNTNSFLKHKNLFMENTQGYVVPAIECCDIDNPEDWEIAEILYKLIQSNSKI